MHTSLKRDHGDLQHRVIRVDRRKPWSSLQTPPYEPRVRAKGRVINNLRVGPEGIFAISKKVLRPNKFFRMCPMAQRNA